MRIMMRMLTAALLLSGGAWAQGQSALEADPSGWVDILPGADLKGWSRVPWVGVEGIKPSTNGLRADRTAGPNLKSGTRMGPGRGLKKRSRGNMP